MGEEGKEGSRVAQAEGGVFEFQGSYVFTSKVSQNVPVALRPLA